MKGAAQGGLLAQIDRVGLQCLDRQKAILDNFAGFFQKDIANLGFIVIERLWYCKLGGCERNRRRGHCQSGFSHDRQGYLRRYLKCKAGSLCHKRRQNFRVNFPAWGCDGRSRMRDLCDDRCWGRR